jgi:hypothetical protein
LKAAAGAARAKIVAPELFAKVLIAMDGAEAALDAGLGWEAFAAFTGPLERRIGFRR